MVEKRGGVVCRHLIAGQHRGLLVPPAAVGVADERPQNAAYVPPSAPSPAAHELEPHGDHLPHHVAAAAAATPAAQHPREGAHPSPARGAPAQGLEAAVHLVEQRAVRDPRPCLFDGLQTKDGAGKF